MILYEDTTKHTAGHEVNSSKNRKEVNLGGIKKRAGYSNSHTY